MTALPFEDRELFPRWRETPKGVPLESLGIRPRFWISRGCAYACSFCTVPTLRKLYPEKKFVRYPTAERAIAEIESVADRWTFSTFVCDDDVFSHKPSWVISEWAAKYPERLKHLHWEMNLRVETVSDELMRALASTGCRLLKFGLESGDPEYRKQAYNRNITNEQTIEAFALARKYGMQAFSFNIAGGVNETRRQIWATIRLNQKLRPDKVQISLYHPYPGTEMGDMAITLGMMTGHADNYFDRSVVANPHMAAWEIEAWAKAFRFLVYAAYAPRLAWEELIGMAKKLRDKWRGIRRRYDIEIPWVASKGKATP